MPILPLHEKCHCIANKIATPTERIVSADCPIEKLTKDIFSKERNEVTGKKDLFEMWGYTIINSLELKRELEKQARMNYSLSEYFLGKLDSHGQRIDVRIKLNRGGEEYVFKSAWMVGKKGKIKCITVYGGK